MAIPDLVITLTGPLLILACLLLLFDFLRLSTADATVPWRPQSAYPVFIPAVVLVLASYLILTIGFVSDSFSIREIFMYSSSSLPLSYKLGGPFIGGNGSLLFITFLLTLVYAGFRVRDRSGISIFRTATYRILDIFVIVFILFTLMKSPFELMPHVPPEGLGLNPLLQTPWVLLHPPVIFLGYVFVFFAFALTLAGMKKEEGDVREGKKALRVSLYGAWLFLALGISLGGVWSYSVLGWGGYWAWDPVETASLLPWLSLTAYFHVPARGQGILKEYTLLLTVCMVLFTTALTRGGFTESLHAFGTSPVGFVFLGFALSLVLYFLLVVRRGEYPRLSWKIDTSSLSSISLFVAYTSILLLLAICLIGVAAPAVLSLFTGVPMAIQGDFYTLWCYPFTLLFVAALIGCNARIHVRSYAFIIAALLIFGGVLVVFGTPTPNPLTNFALPLLFVSAVIIVDAGVQALLKRITSPRLAGRILVHLAIVLILIGVAISSASAVESTTILARPNTAIDVLGARLIVGEPGLQDGAGKAYYSALSLVGPEAAAMEMPVVIRWDGGTQNGVLRMRYFPVYGVVSEPLILSTPTKDLYISMHQTNSSYLSLKYALIGEQKIPEDLILVVKRVPLISLIWAGMVILILGIGLLILGELAPFRSAQEKD